VEGQNLIDIISSHGRRSLSGDHVLHTLDVYSHDLNITMLCSVMLLADRSVPLGKLPLHPVEHAAEALVLRRQGIETTPER
jgi:hypothetical protein